MVDGNIVIVTRDWVCWRGLERVTGEVGGVGGVEEYTTMDELWMSG